MLLLPCTVVLDWPDSIQMQCLVSFHLVFVFNLGYCLVVAHMVLTSVMLFYILFYLGWSSAMPGFDRDLSFVFFSLFYLYFITFFGQVCVVHN